MPMPGNSAPGDCPAIGLIGVGLLGGALAERFLAGGYPVFGFDIARDRLAALKESAGSAAEVAERVNRLVLSLPHSRISKAVVKEIESRLAPGAIVMDTTTGSPEDAEQVAARLATRGVHYLDATVGGSSRQVRAREAIVICGGDRDAFEACAGLFECFAARTFHMGPAGAGSRMKLVLNLALGLNRAVLAESLGFARSQGIEPARALEVLRASPAYSRVMDTKGAKMLTGDYTPEARLSQHLKDVRLIIEAGRARGARLPLSELHRELLESVEAAGLGGADNSAVFEWFRSPREVQRD